MNKTEIPLKEIEMLADYCEMDLINGVQMNQEEWTDVVDKVRAWLDKNAEGHAPEPDAANSWQKKHHPTSTRLIKWFGSIIPRRAGNANRSTDT